MSNPNRPHETRVAVLLDCDNVPTEIVEHALLMVAQFGRAVLRCAYGNHNTLANKWREVLVRQTFQFHQLPTNLFTIFPDQCRLCGCAKRPIRAT
ncbi:hypothetical protein [Xanthomonas campestris]|uniref:hypothetical protein n=1 Tax=Xanthomonas campestris TaxID=339 RepID=UPI00209F73FA|nr:hypothetical protein [Xanthomonas campestris]